MEIPTTTPTEPLTEQQASIARSVGIEAATVAELSSWRNRSKNAANVLFSSVCSLPLGGGWRRVRDGADVTAVCAPDGQVAHRNHTPVDGMLASQNMRAERLLPDPASIMLDTVSVAAEARVPQLMGTRRRRFRV